MAHIYDDVCLHIFVMYWLLAPQTSVLKHVRLQLQRGAIAMSVLFGDPLLTGVI